MACRVSFTLVLTILTLMLSLVPAIVIWVVFMDLMTSSVDLLRGTTQDTTDSMAQRMQELLMTEAVAKFDSRLAEGETEVAVYKAFVQSIGLQNRDLRPSHFDNLNGFLVPYRSYVFAAMKGHALFSSLAISAGIFSNASSNIGGRAFTLSYSASYLDISTNALGNRTLYYGGMSMTPDEKFIAYNSSYPNQVTGVPLIFLLKTTIPWTASTMTYVPSQWETKLSFSAYSGLVQLTRWEWIPAQNNTMVQVSVSIDAATLSDELQEQLGDAPNDRLVLFFRQPHGYMAAASHGKYWSESDIDRRYISTITNPPNISNFKLWNCIQSTDALISQACRQLYAQYQSWPAIPAQRQEMVLSGQRYWVATGFSSASLQVTVLMLKNRASVMGSIDASNAEVDHSVSNKKGVTFIVLGVISAVAVMLPVAVGLWLASRLRRLATGMDGIAKLQFNNESLQPTVFRELHRFQTSFTQMERGLQAFGKFVPQAVVRVLIGGQMKATDEMNPETLTIMFADIEGFSTICENVPSSVLVTVCTEYFEAMCSSIVQRNGTIDKFIGDCIMAMWNAPERMPGHEKDAVDAALAMQTSVLQLHPSWQQRGLPLLKFRLGIHTGVCLVGNFGCSYRVSYTSLGDGVNLSARLEALNKKFGTHICVSQATYDGCREHFHFRRLAKVTVPGKTEVLPVYEVLCERDPAESPKPMTPKFAGAPGIANSNGMPDMMSPLSSTNSLDCVLVHHFSPQLKGADRSFEKASPGQVVYHWMYVDRAALLWEAREYELAYEALVAGDRGRAQQLVASKAVPAVPDKAWAALAGQLEHCEPGRPWDGVFYFREK
eukprot:EG_transcript_2463